jgi:hypothetical protein
MALGKGLPSPFVEDHTWPKTTPVTAIRMVSKELERMDVVVKDWAYRLGNIARSLAANVEFSGGAPLHGAASAGTKGYTSGDKGEGHE